MDAAVLHRMIAQVCPIEGVAIPDPGDKATWRIDFGQGTTPVQREAAQRVIEEFNVELESLRGQKLAELEDILGRCDVLSFMRGVQTDVSGEDIGDFLAKAANNYRQLKRKINGVSRFVDLELIDVHAGWPSV